MILSRSLFHLPCIQWKKMKTNHTHVIHCSILHTLLESCTMCFEPKVHCPCPMCIDAVIDEIRKFERGKEMNGYGK